MKRLQNINYDDDSFQYDWKLVFRHYKSLKCPSDVFDPTTVPIKDISYYFGLSTRSVGKTTGWVLIGMILNALYGTTTVYVRNIEEQTAPKYSRELMNVILSYENARYIMEITDGKYNHVKYDARRLYYVLRDENGKEIDRAPDPFLIMVSLDNWQEYKSVLNVYRGDFMLFDEFIETYYRPESFEHYMDIQSTIGRWRDCRKNIFLANTTRYTSQWYREFCIQAEIRRLKIGEKMLLESPGGTPMYIELVEPLMKEKIKKAKSRFFGFPNPALNAIVGMETAWSLPIVPRIRYEDDDKVLFKIRVKGEDELKIVLVFNNRIGLHCNVYPATTKRKDDEYMLTLNEPESRKDLFAFGRGKVLERIWTVYKQNLFFYSDNETGVVLQDYVQRSKEALKKF